MVLTSHNGIYFQVNAKLKCKKKRKLNDCCFAFAVADDYEFANKDNLLLTTNEIDIRKKKKNMRTVLPQ